MATEKQRQYAHQYYLRNKERLKPIRAAWMSKNLQRYKDWHAKYELENADAISERKKRHRVLHRDEYLKRARKYRINNRSKRIAYQKQYNALRIKERREYKQRRRSTDLFFRIRETLASRINSAVKRKQPGTKSSKTTQLLGCDIPFFKQYISERFSAGMGWDNYGMWHFDHIIPCAAFDLSNPTQQRSCFHYSNLQPMWASQNRSKSSKLPGSHQAELI